MLCNNIWGWRQSLGDWILGADVRESEVLRLLVTTNDIIRKISRYASQIVESRYSAANRKEKYKKFCQMFLTSKDIDVAHKVSFLTKVWSYLYMVAKIPG